MHLILDHDRAVLFHGDCRDLPSMIPDNSVDAIICDPPYLLANASGTGFMGREWDSVKLEDGETVGTASERWHRTWAAIALRVLKPGGHLLAFGGSRTFHRMCSAIEDVGFELRDVLMWMYGQGFPKSMDIAKQVDKSDAASERRRRALAFTAWMRSTGLSSGQIDTITGTNMGSHYLTEKQQPQVATREHLELLRPHVGAVPDEIEELVGHRQVLSEQFAMREVVGVEEVDARVARPGLPGGIGAPKREVAITEPYTAAAKKWEGWGTALKPAYEPIALARKPPVDTVAANVLEWGVGGINIGACRIGDEVRFNGPSGGAADDSSVYQLGMRGKGEGTTAVGRWPANVILDEIAGAMLDAQSGTSKDGVAVRKNGNKVKKQGLFGLGQMEGEDVGYGGEGGASRFFYCPKPSRAEKEAGLDHLPMKSGSEITGRQEGSAGIQHARAGAGAKGGARNTHVTVKPVALMRYLCRLITPPGGTVLDVFAGSGTTGVAALAEGFNFVGTELGGDDGSHLPILLGRIRHALGLPQEPPPEPAR
jgi:DNA modification methylase